MINWIQGQPLAAKFRALISDSGMFSPLSTALATDELFFYKFYFGGYPEDGDEVRRRYERCDPVGFVKGWRTPQLVVHAEGDWRVPFEEGVKTFQTLRRRGVDSRLVRVGGGEGHAILGRDEVKGVYGEIVGWLKRWGGGGEER